MILMVLAALGAAVVGAVGTLAVRDLGRTSQRSSALQSALQHYESAIRARSGIDTEILRAASVASTGGTYVDGALRLDTVVGGSLIDARTDFEKAGVGPDLIGAFDAMSVAMFDYVAIAVTLTGELATDPAAAPAHLADLEVAALELQRLQTALADQLDAYTSQVRVDSRSSVLTAQSRTLAVTGAGVAVLLLLAILSNRRIRQALAAKKAAQAASVLAKERLVEQVSRQRFTEELRESLEAALDEPATLNTVKRALNHLPLQGVAEVLLADSSRAHVRRVVATSDAPGCGIASPWDCPAVRGGRSLVFDSSDALRACPHLHGREGGPVSASCVPLLFNGRGIGVLHAVGRDGEVPDPLVASELVAVASETATRIGTIRVLAKTQFQAKTDGLTGMANRRTLEDRLRQLVSADQPFTLAMADLDHFKVLNDTYGHEGGDRALRVFSTAVHDLLRGDDIAGRFGGEEFVLAFPELSKDDALLAIERLRQTLSVATEGGACPPFTASFGVAEWHPGLTVDELLRRADARLYEAKVQGRDRVIAADPQPAALL